jgi:hypothetical protein
LLFEDLTNGILENASIPALQHPARELKTEVTT